MRDQDLAARRTTRATAEGQRRGKEKRPVAMDLAT